MQPPQGALRITCTPSPLAPASSLLASPAAVAPSPAHQAAAAAAGGSRGPSSAGRDTSPAAAALAWARRKSEALAQPLGAVGFAAGGQASPGSFLCHLHALGLWGQRGLWGVPCAPTAGTSFCPSTPSTLTAGMRPSHPSFGGIFQGMQLNGSQGPPAIVTRQPQQPPSPCPTKTAFGVSWVQPEALGISPRLRFAAGTASGGAAAPCQALWRQGGQRKGVYLVFYLGAEISQQGM